MTPNPLKYYQHRYGGVYKVITSKAYSSVDKSEWVVYSHAYPFETHVWIRPYDEFVDGRFRELSGDELDELLFKDREEFQKEIADAKNASKPPPAWVFPKAADFEKDL